MLAQPLGVLSMLRDGLLQCLRRSAVLLNTHYCIGWWQPSGRAEQLVLPSLLGWHHMTQRGVKKQAKEVNSCCDPFLG